MDNLKFPLKSLKSNCGYKKTVSFDCLDNKIDSGKDSYLRNYKGTFKQPLTSDAFNNLKNVLNNNKDNSITIFDKMKPLREEINQNELNLDYKRSIPMPLKRTIILAKKDFRDIPLKETPKPADRISVPRKKDNSFRIFWRPSKNEKTKNFGEGKVKELTEHFEKMKFEIENPEYLCKQPPLPKKISEYLKTRSNPELNSFQRKDKLTRTEQERILRQLREWSEFGSNGKDKSDKSYNVHRSKSYSRCYDEFQKHIDDRLHISTSHWKSEPSLEHFEKLDVYYEIPKSSEDLSSIHIETVIVSNSDDRNYSKVPVQRERDSVKSPLSKTVCYKSCPELSQKYSPFNKSTNYSPRHTSNYMTLRKLKRNTHSSNEKFSIYYPGILLSSTLDSDDLEEPK